MRPWWRASQIRSQRGQALVDYALILVLLSLAVVTAAATVGGSTFEYYQRIWDIIDAALP